MGTSSGAMPFNARQPEVQPYKVVHLERTHSRAKAENGIVYLIRGRALQNDFTGLSRIA